MGYTYLFIYINPGSALHRVSQRALEGNQGSDLRHSARHWDVVAEEKGLWAALGGNAAVKESTVILRINYQTRGVCSSTCSGAVLQRCCCCCCWQLQTTTTTTTASAWLTLKAGEDQGARQYQLQWQLHQRWRCLPHGGFRRHGARGV